MTRGRKAASILLSLAMVTMTLAAWPASNAKAESAKAEITELEIEKPEHAKATSNATSIFIAGKEGSGDFQSCYGYWEQEWIYTDGYTELTDGKSVWQDQGQSTDNNAKAKFTYGDEYSVLELDGYKTSGTVGYVKANQEASGNDLYGIYYDGNLKIIVYGENELCAYYPGTFTNVFGIYVTGDLIITSDRGTPSLYVDMHTAKDTMLTQGRAAGIRCLGSLKVEGGTTYPMVTAKAGKVTGEFSQQIPARSCGIECETYQQAGGKVTGNGGNAFNSFGVKGRNFNVSRGTLIGKAPATEDQDSYGIYAIENMIVSGGSVSGEAGDDSTLGWFSRGISVSGYDSVFSGGTISGKAGNAKESCGVYMMGLTIPEGSNTSLTGIGGTYATERNFGIHVDGVPNRTHAVISGGTVTAIGGDGPNTASAYDYGYGLYVINSDLTISKNACVEARAGACYSSRGLQTQKLKVSDDAYVKAEGGASAHGNYGISVSKTLEMTGGNVFANAGEYNYPGNVGMELGSAESVEISGGSIVCDGLYGSGMLQYTAPIHLTGGNLVAKGKTRAIVNGNDQTTAARFCGGVNYDGSSLETASTYDPNWRYAIMADENTCIVSFDANGGSGSMEPVLLSKNDVFSFPACGFTPPTGSEFIGWKVSGGLYVYDEGESYGKVTADLNVFPSWRGDIEITKQPRDWYGTIGKKATFTVEATGTELSYQWQYKKSGKWYNYAITTADTDTFKVTMNEKNMKWPIRCVISNASGQQVITREVWMKDSSVSAPITITKQPEDWYGTIGKKATFTVEATGNGLTYQWQYKKGIKWMPYTVATATTATLKVTMNALNMTYPIRCKITDEDGFTATTNEVRMKLKEEPVTDGPVITKQPVDWYGTIGKKAYFSVEATGNSLTYQWQYKKGTADWTDYAITTADTPNFSVTMNEKNVKWTYRCVITDADGKTAITNEVHMRLKEEEPAPAGITITSQPSDYTGKIGKKATFTVAATGEGLTYEWQVKKTTSWSAYPLAGYDTPTFQVSISDKTAKWTYRCVIRDANGNEVATNEVRIYIVE